jgi:hypothetical protein
MNADPCLDNIIEDICASILSVTFFKVHCYIFNSCSCGLPQLAPPSPELRHVRRRVIIAERFPKLLYNFPVAPSCNSNLASMPLIRVSRAAIPRALRSFSTTSARSQSAIPYTPSCPSPTCECAATPPGLDIDRKTPLLNTMAAYSEQVVFCTGKEDWVSNIEQEEDGTGEFVRGLKDVIGKGSPGFDVGLFPSQFIF